MLEQACRLATDPILDHLWCESEARLCRCGRRGCDDRQNARDDQCRCSPHLDTKHTARRLSSSLVSRTARPPEATVISSASDGQPRQVTLCRCAMSRRETDGPDGSSAIEVHTKTQTLPHTSDMMAKATRARRRIAHRLSRHAVGREVFIGSGAQAACGQKSMSGTVDRPGTNSMTNNDTRKIQADAFNEASGTTERTELCRCMRTHQDNVIEGLLVR